MKLKEERVAAGVRQISKPWIEFDNPDEYYTPQEFFTKSLINSPLEFGTLELSRSMGVQEGMERVLHWEIDLAMHPQLGVLICGYVGGEGGAQFQERLDEELGYLREKKENLLAYFEGNYEMERLPMPSVGLFIVAPHLKTRGKTLEWRERDEVFICAENRVDRVASHVMAAMSRYRDERCGEPFSDWARLMAVVEGERYTSALQWLLIYEEI